MSNSQKPSSAKCFSSILRKFICIGHHPTHPSEDLFIEHQTKDVKHSEEDSKPSSQSASAPGIVARLMGLDSLPHDHLINLSPKEKTFGSFLRSRSVNFLDNTSPFDVSEKLQHRRVKTSISFSEDGDEFFVVCFNKVDEEIKGRKGLQMKKPEVKYQQQVQSKVYDNNGEKFVAKRSSNKRVIKDSNRVHKVENVKARRSLKHHSSNIKHRSSRCLANKQRPECHTGKTSPHSQLHSKVTKPGNSGPIYSKKSPPKLTNIEGSICNNKESSIAIRSNLEKPMKTFETDYYKNMLNNVSKLSEDDIKGTSWVANEMLAFEDLEEICVHFGQQIFEKLLNQVVDELLVLHMMK